MVQNTPLVLLVLDGWGYRAQNKHNAIAQAHTPQWDSWWQNYPHTLLEASGKGVGLPEKQMGNSEVGHMHIGAGRIIQQDFTRINEAIAKGAFAQNALLQETITHLKQTKKSLHLMGLLSPGGVHSHENHLFALLAFCATQRFHSVKLHLFLDGRDTPPQSALKSITRLEIELEQYPVGTISSIAGRYYAMDRDKRWERIEPVYKMLTSLSKATQFSCVREALAFYYGQQTFDEFIPPTPLGEPSAIEDGDALLFFNFRADRARQLSVAFIDPVFTGFKKEESPSLSYFITMTQYDKKLPSPALFPPSSLTNTLGEFLSRQGFTQLRIAETEKYAHVTFFFNGGNELVFPGEERILVPSPQVATYDLQPKMSALQLTEHIVKAIRGKTHDVIIANYANADMVGHTGNFTAAVKAVECLDECLSQVGKALREVGGTLLITADHGNAEAMFDEETNQAHTAHTSELVPLLFIGEGWHFTSLKGSLIDVAPTLLSLLGFTPPKDMTGKVLLEKTSTEWV